MAYKQEGAVYLSHSTWPQVQDYLKESKKIIFPLGSTEQHGPSGLIGIDYLSSESLAAEVSAKTSTMLAPVLPFGMAQHHMEFPGTISFSPLTYVKVICEVLESLAIHGFEKILIINGHGGNIAPLTTAFSEALMSRPKLQMKLINWWHLKEVQDYEKVHFGEKNGFHATCGEVSLTRYTHPEAYKKIIFKEEFETIRNYPWPMSPSEFRKSFPDGRMASQPFLSSAEHGQKIFNLAAASIVETITKL